MNKRGLKVTEYDDEENTVIMKPIPIMDVDSLKDMFAASFAGTGNFNTGKTFQYAACVIDLAPATYVRAGTTHYSDKYYSGLDPSLGKFPMKFVGTVSANSGNQYKTKKLLLSRIDSISGEKFDTFTMGSHKEDYDLVKDL